MKAWNIIAYCFDAGIHCIDCTPEAYMEEDAEDSEGNPVHPVFASDEMEEGECCGDCGEEI